MSYMGSKADAVSAIHSVEESPTTGHGNTSMILRGHDSPGGAANGTTPAGETQMVGRLRKGINSPRTSTDKLRRKYAAS